MTETLGTDDAEMQLEQIAQVTGKSEAKIRAILWEEIASRDTGSANGERIYARVINDIYEDVVPRVIGEDADPGPHSERV